MGKLGEVKYLPCTYVVKGGLNSIFSAGTIWRIWSLFGIFNFRLNKKNWFLTLKGLFSFLTPSGAMFSDSLFRTEFNSLGIFLDFFEFNSLGRFLSILIHFIFSGNKNKILYVSINLNIHSRRWLAVNFHYPVLIGCETWMRRFKWRHCQKWWIKEE